MAVCDGAVEAALGRGRRRLQHLDSLLLPGAGRSTHRHLPEADALCPPAGKHVDTVAARHVSCVNVWTTTSVAKVHWFPVRAWRDASGMHVAARHS